MTIRDVNSRRLARTFMELVRTDSPSREEGRAASMVGKMLASLPATEILEDASRSRTGSDTGNIVVRLRGNKPAPPLFFNAHLDTVEPGRNIKPELKDGIFRSDGTTILGADDKSAVAILIEAAMILAENRIPHGPVEFVFTVCEEIGLLGAKAFDPALIEARHGYALDSTDTSAIINSAPCAIRFKIRLLGRSAHAGLDPENGVNAILIASRAMAGLQLGRIDEITTANIGVMRGGTATNIVPDEVTVEGEVRSHDPRRMQQVQDSILAAFHQTVLDWEPSDCDKSGPDRRPAVQTEVTDDYPLMSVPEDNPLITTALASAEKLGRNLKLAQTGGGSDANVFNGKGMSTVIMGVGMQKVHTTSEYILLDDMISTTRLVVEIIQNWPCTA
ncbi:MAG TPA: M20/M25/M40 family metallo-hydrolase [Thermodesulfobacteriaceae bacterium]|nr:M20/M25/M40 family metallo-hydrolase [Thermodesulfobacteriaceae bacterium]